MIVGNRIPREYFVTSGKGESDITVHAGSFDRALREANIHNYNIIKYSSIMPRTAVRVDMPKKRVHGSVMECIMAEKYGNKGEDLAAGIIIGWVFEKESGENIGGLVAEYSGNANKEKAEEKLNKMIEEMFECRYDKEVFELGEREIFIETLVPQKNYGSVLVAICFTSHEIPVLD